MKKNLLMLFTIIGVLISINVYAASSNEWDNQSSTDNYSTLKNGYNSKNKVSVSSTGTTVTLYGRASNCTTNGCTNIYSFSNNDNYKDAIANAITCANGEKYFTASYLSSGKEAFVKKTDQTFTPQSSGGYWAEEYLVTCTSQSSSSTTPISTSNSTTTTNSNNTSSTNSNSSYSSSTTTNQESTGVNEYFGVLGLVAIISYVFMLCVKKYNLFKNI